MLILLGSYTWLFCLSPPMHPSALVWALSQLISAPFASIYIQCHLNLVLLKTPFCKINLNLVSCMQKSHHLKGALCPISLLTNVKTSALLWLFSFPPASSSCQRKPVHFANRKETHSPANHLYHCVNNHILICPPHPSAALCLTLGLEGPWWMHSLWWLHFCHISKKLIALALIHT